MVPVSALHLIPPAISALSLPGTSVAADPQRAKQSATRDLAMQG